MAGFTSGKKVYGKLSIAYEFEQVEISTVAKGLTAAKYLPAVGTKSADRVIIAVEDNSIRFRYDGTSPTATVGMPADAGDIIILDGYTAIKNFEAIRSGSADAKLSVIFENN